MAKIMPIKKKPPITVDAARDAILAAERARADACRKEIAAVLERYRCKIVAEMVLRAAIAPRTIIQIEPVPD